MSLVKKCRHDRSAWGRCGCAWYASLLRDGKRTYTNLGPERSEAQRRYRLLAGTDDVGRGFRAVRECFIDDCAHRLRPQSLDRYRSLTAHAVEWFGDADIADIGGPDIVEMVDALLAAGLSPSHVRTIRNLTIAVLRFGAERGVIERVPDVPAMRAARSQSEVDVLDLATAERIIAELPEPERALSQLVLWTGLRPGEALALRDDDIDDGVLRVERTQRIVDGTVGPPKTRRGRRRVELPQAARDALAELELPAQTTYKRWSGRLASACKAAHVPQISLKTLRHTNASLRLHAGQSVPVVAQQLGHSPEILLSTYAHVVRDIGAGQVGLLDALRQRAAP